MSSKKTGLVYHGRFLDHLTGDGHPESPARLESLVRRLKDVSLWDELRHLRFHEADVSRVETIHAAAYVSRFRDTCIGATPVAAMDTMDCRVSKESYEIALFAVGGVLAAVDAVMQGKIRNAFCAVRPPGHHAEHDRAMGFCYFNNIAIAAEYLVREFGLERVAIVDFDVHHGNGTQHAFDRRSDILFISVHESPQTIFPGTGYADEMGSGPGKGFTVNIPMPPFSTDADYRTVFSDRIMPALEEFQPEFLLLDTGFDVLDADPIGHLRLTPGSFGWMTDELCRCAERHCRGRVVSVIEGGYDLDASALAAEFHIRSLLRWAKKTPKKGHIPAPNG